VNEQQRNFSTQNFEPFNRMNSFSHFDNPNSFFNDDFHNIEDLLNSMMGPMFMINNGFFNHGFIDDEDFDVPNYNRTVIPRQDLRDYNQSKAEKEFKPKYKNSKIYDV
jgi:hypothetical protein